MMPVIMRIRLSVPPPGAKGTTTSMFFERVLGLRLDRRYGERGQQRRAET